MLQAAYLYQTHQRSASPEQTHFIYGLASVSAKEIAGHIGAFASAQLGAKDILEIADDSFASGFVISVTPIAYQAGYAVSQWRGEKCPQWGDDYKEESISQSAERIGAIARSYISPTSFRCRRAYVAHASTQ
jgi:hypothetical protein